jgi:hypothetical protein
MEDRTRNLMINRIERKTGKLETLNWNELSDKDLEELYFFICII